MSQAFISYAHAQLDDALAHFLKAFLAQRGHTVFLDTDIPGGKRWAEEIEKKIRTSEFFIVLLSKDAILSDMVRQEVKFAYSLAQDQNQQLTIIPVRIDFSGELPLDLGAYLDPLQYILWTGRNDYEALGTQICDVMDRSAALPISEKQEEEEGLQELASLTEEGGAPLPAADLRLLETGAVPLDSPFYIRREADIQLERQILGDGTTTIVKGARQSGKSSLLARAHAQAQEHQRRSFYLDFQMIDERFLASLEMLFQYIARLIARDLHTQLKPDEVWDEYLGPQDNLTYFIEKAILSETQTPLLLLFDEADRVFDYPYRDAFFATIRGWHNRRANNPSWKRFNIVIAHSTEPNLWIQDLYQSPFNVGHPIRLGDLTNQHVAELNTKYGAPLKDEQDLHDLLELVGGI